MQTNRKSRFVGVGLAALLLTLPIETASGRGALVGRMAPEIRLTSGMYGITPRTTLKGFRGDVVLLVLWSTRCPHCRTHMRLIQRLHTRYKARGLRTLAIVSSNHYDALRFMRSNGYNFGVGVDTAGTSARRYGVRRYPGTFIIGRDGRIKSSPGKLYRAIERELAVKK